MRKIKIIQRIKANGDHRKEAYKLLFLLQMILLIAAIVYFSFFKWELLEEAYRAPSIDTVLMVLLLISGIVGIGSMYLFREMVSLIETEKEFDLQKLKIKQMEEANDLLRSQKHDFSNNLQVIWGLLCLGNIEKAREYINKMTDTLKIDESDMMEIEKMDCPHLYTLFLNKSYKCKDLDIYIHYNIDPTISLKDQFNPIDLIRIFGNLLDNAIYEVKSLGNDLKEIAVEIYKEKGYYFFKVYNRGPVIPADIKDYIFNKGFTTKSEEGSGMGLYNVKEIVKKYKGEIWVESSEEFGTQFTIQIPIRLG